MTTFPAIRQGPLEELFDDMDDPVFIIHEDRTLLFQNNAATQLLIANPDLMRPGHKLQFRHPYNTTQLARLVRICQSSLHTGANACVLGPRPTVQRDPWLLTVSSLTCALAVLHPVYVVRLSSGRKLQRLPRHLLHDLFHLTRREITIITALGRNHSLPRIATDLKLPTPTVSASIKRIKAKCAVRSRAELLTLLHKLKQLSG